MFATIDVDPMELNEIATVIGLGATVEDSIREPAEFEGVEMGKWSMRLAELRRMTFPCTDDVVRAVAMDAGLVQVRLRGSLCRKGGKGVPLCAKFLDLA